MSVRLCCTEGAVRIKQINLNSDKLTQTDKQFLHILFCNVIATEKPSEGWMYKSLCNRKAYVKTCENKEIQI